MQHQNLQHNTQELPTNGWQAMGKVTNWVLTKLTGADLHIYLTIAKYTIGYYQSTSDFLSYSDISDFTGLSKRTIERSVPYLIEQQYIIRVATNQIAYAGKLPYKYQLNFKLPGFPPLGKLRSSKAEAFTKQQPEFTCPPTADYILQNGRIVAISSIAPDKLKLLAERNMLVHPTIEQLTNHLKEL